jgi:hypothetical protein
MTSRSRPAGSERTSSVVASCGKKRPRLTGGPWWYLLAAQQVIGTSGWIVREHVTETGEVLDERSPGLHQDLTVQKELVRRLHQKARAS